MKFNLDERRKKSLGSLICTFQPSENSLPTRYDCTSQLSYKCRKYNHVHHLTKHISTKNFDLTLVYTVSQLTLSMDIFNGLHDQYNALVGASRRENKKEINRDLKQRT